MKKIGIYPGNFQPADRSHFEAYKKLKSLIGGNDVFIAMTDREPIPDAPLNFGDKEQIWVRHGVPASHIIKVQSLPTDNVGKLHEWRPEEIYHKFSGNQTVVVLALNKHGIEYFSKRKSVDKITQNKETWLGTNGKPQYFQPYKGNENTLEPFEKHVYVVGIDDTKVQGQSVSTSNIRDALGSPKYNDNQKKKFFRFIFGWFDVGLYQLMVSKFRNAYQATHSEGDVKLNEQTIKYKQIQEMVYEILNELIDEDYSTSMTQSDSSSNDNMTNGMASSLDNEDPAKIARDATQNRINLVKQKKELEAKDKQDKQQRDGYSILVYPYDMPIHELSVS